MKPFVCGDKMTIRADVVIEGDVDHQQHIWVRGVCGYSAYVPVSWVIGANTDVATAPTRETVGYYIRNNLEPVVAWFSKNGWTTREGRGLPVSLEYARFMISRTARGDRLVRVTRKVRAK